MRRLSPVNLLLGGIIVLFAIWELVAVLWDEPGEDDVVTLSEIVWSGGLYVQIPASLLMLWAAFHFIAPKYDPVMRLMNRRV